MKKWLILVLALVIVGALTWLAFFWHRPAPVAEKKNVAEEESGALVDVAKLKSFALENSLGKIKFEKDANDAWWIVEPEKDDINGTFFNALMDSVKGIYPGGEIPFKEQEPLKQYGLNPPAAKLSFVNKDGSGKVLLVGKFNPNASALYAMMEGGTEVFLIPNNIKMFLQHDWGYYRYARITGISREQIKELKIVILDPKLREQFGAPEVRHLVLQVTNAGKAWVFLEPRQEPAYSVDVGDLMTWIAQASFASKIIDLKATDLPGWEFDPPRAYFEFTYPDRTEKILVGKEDENLIYLFQPKRMAALGFDKSKIYGFLANDYRPKILMTQTEMASLVKVEVSFPASSKPGYMLQKMEGNLWSVNGDPAKEFRKHRVTWLTKPYMETPFMAYLNKRPIELKALGLQIPKAELKFYSENGLIHDIVIGKWDPRQNMCFVYDPSEDKVVFYAEDMLGLVPPDADKFLIKAAERKK